MKLNTMNHFFKGKLLTNNLKRRKRWQNEALGLAVGKFETESFFKLLNTRSHQKCKKLYDCLQ